MYAKILIIEDEKDLIKGLKLNLTDEGYEVEYALSGLSGLEKALKYKPDLILLDIMLPEMDGLDVCRKLRQKKFASPIIMLTAKGDEIDKVVGLEIGADDYITKPFSLRELLARIKAHLRRTQRKKDVISDVYSFGDVKIDFIRFKISCKERSYSLTSMEMDILKYLISHSGEVVTRENLLDKIWGFKSSPTTRTIDNHILKLRKKIEEDPAYPRYILSVYGEGYRFMG
ncbi:MAG: response regulator transcription factor [Candidatus Aminicenantes bacterium]|nr:response regulator transcription factor [Candidatus Aminicenantes bacterium]